MCKRPLFQLLIEAPYPVIEAPYPGRVLLQLPVEPLRPLCSLFEFTVEFLDPPGRRLQLPVEPLRPLCSLFEFTVEFLDPPGRRLQLPVEALRPPCSLFEFPVEFLEFTVEFLDPPGRRLYLPVEALRLLVGSILHLLQSPARDFELSSIAVRPRVPLIGQFLTRGGCQYSDGRTGWVPQTELGTERLTKEGRGAGVVSHHCQDVGRLDAPRGDLFLVALVHLVDETPVP